MPPSRNQTTASESTERSARRYDDRHADDDARPDATVEICDSLGVSLDEDRGGDPYNHTGRFKRSIR